VAKFKERSMRVAAGKKNARKAVFFVAIKVGKALSTFLFLFYQSKITLEIASGKRRFRLL
jgi:hypothetical protein